MFTVEIEPDATIVTVMCEDNNYEDVQVILQDDDGVVIRQFDEDLGKHDCVFLTYNMLIDVYASLSSPEGMFQTRRLRKNCK